MKNYIFLKPFLLLTIFLSFFLSTPNQANANMFQKKLPTTPISVPIDISRKGNKAEIDLRIETKAEKEELEPENTAFELEFFYDDPTSDPKNKYYEGFFRRNFKDISIFKKYFREHAIEDNKEISKDYHRVLQLMEREELIPSGAGAAYKSQWIQHKGIPIPNIHLTIISLDDPSHKIIFDQVLEVKKNNRVVSYFMKSITRINIKPGNYKITAEIMSDAPEFAGTKVMLIIGSYRGKV